MILGDLQETITTSDKDNSGNFREELSSHGPLYNCLHSHTSIVRDQLTHRGYTTRFGDKGSRGINHILFPKNPNFHDWIVDTALEYSTGYYYFPSDHCLLTMNLSRFGANNNDTEYERIRHRFSEIFSIKMKTNPITGALDRIDTSQFFTGKVQEQQDLYEHIQAITSDTSSTSGHIIHNLDQRCDSLLKSLYNSGLDQGASGDPKNKLVRITKAHVIELTSITDKFDEGIKLIMDELKLTHKESITKMADAKKMRIQKGQVSQAFFAGIPIQTKLR